MIPVDRNRLDQTRREAVLTALKDVKAGKTELERARVYYQSNPDQSYEFAAYSDNTVKAAINAIFEFKCAYCESGYGATAPVDVEHFRPKGRVKTPAGDQQGYWWLAADWDNLLASCIHCNRANTQTLFDGRTLVTGKADHFPLADESKRARSEGAEAHETHLLINPCAEDPRALLRFVVAREGPCDLNNPILVKPVLEDAGSLGHRRAQTSIEIYGLNRVHLVKERTTRAKAVMRSLGSLRKAARDMARATEGPAREEHLQEMEAQRDAIREYCANDAPYAGMSRALAEPALSAMGISLFGIASTTPPSNLEGKPSPALAPPDVPRNHEPSSEPR